MERRTRTPVPCVEPAAMMRRKCCHKGLCSSVAKRAVGVGLCGFWGSGREKCGEEWVEFRMEIPRFWRFGSEIAAALWLRERWLNAVMVFLFNCYFWSVNCAWHGVFNEEMGMRTRRVYPSHRHHFPSAPTTLQSQSHFEIRRVSELNT